VNENYYYYYYFYILRGKNITYQITDFIFVERQGRLTYVFWKINRIPHDHVIAIFIRSVFSLHFYCQLSFIREFRDLYLVHYGRHVCAKVYWVWTNEAVLFYLPQPPRSWPGMYF
jgi:hypothetical protein